MKIGVDVEKSDRVFHENPIAIAERFFHEDEILKLKKISRDALQKQFLELWIQKEAYGKLTRQGLKKSIHANMNKITGCTIQNTPVIPEGYLSAIAFHAP